jgi:glycerate 2-kinase
LTVIDHKFWQGIFNHAVGEVTPVACLPENLPDPGLYSAIKVIAAGKAAAAMAQTLEKSWPKQKLEGMAVCPYGYERSCEQIAVYGASHPLPDENSVAAADKALTIAASVKSGELLLVLLSGGGSSLLCAPLKGMSLAVKQTLTQQLLRCGASIDEINLVRSYYSRIKGGGLLGCMGAGGDVLTLAISDVVSNDPAKIASGPTVYRDASEAEVMDLLARYGISQPKIDAIVPTSRPSAGTYKIIADAAVMLDVAHARFAGLGFDVFDLGRAVQGEARLAAKKHAALIIQAVAENLDSPIAFISGGELTVTCMGAGIGGPNQEYLLAIMAELPPGKFAGFAADTDGCDGVGGAAGAFFDQQTHLLAHQKNSYKPYLDNNDSFNFFKWLSGNFNVPPTFTNVNDLRIILYLADENPLLTEK